MGKGFKLTVNPPASGTFYYAGQEVTGTVTIKNTEPKRYIRVEIRLTGQASVKIGDMAGWEKEELINHHIILWDREHAPNKELPPGEHNFPFRVQLHSPNLGTHIPTTYESPFAKVVYELDAGILKEGKLKRDARIQQVINVIEIVDINTHDMQQPKALVTDRNLAYTSLSSSSPVSLTVRLPRTGFSIHNDNITFEVEIANPKKRRTGPLTVQLFKDSKYGNSIYYNNRRNFNRIVRGAMATTPVSKSDSNFKWSGSIPVPFTEPTSTYSSVRVGYYLSIVLTVPMTNSGNMCMTFPIIIGSVLHKPPPPPLANPGRQMSYYQPQPAPGPPIARYYSQPALDSYPAAGQQYPPQPYSPQSAQHYQQQQQSPYPPHQPPYPVQPHYIMPTQPPYSPESQPPPGATAIPPPGATAAPPPEAGAVPPPGEWVAPPPQNPYWDPNQGSVTLPRHWTHSPQGVVPGAEEGPPLPPPPSYDETMAASPLTGKQAEAEKTTHFN